MAEVAPRDPGSLTSSERGSVSMLAAAVMLMVVVMALATSDVARALSAVSRAQAAADAAALAAAQEMVEPTGESPAVATVRVEITGLLFLRSGRATMATARAVIDFPGAARASTDSGPKTGARMGDRPVE